MVLQEDKFALVRPQSPKPRRVVESGLNASGKTTRTVEVLTEDGTECITFGAAGGTKSDELIELIASMCKLDGSKIKIVSQVGSYRKVMGLFEEVPTKVTALGLRSFTRKYHQFQDPIVVIGGGLGGIQTLIQFVKDGRKDIVCLEKLHDFGGWSWMGVANKFTKLQTERGTYHVNFMLEGLEVPEQYADTPYKTWPTRDQLIRMFRESAREHGLYDITNFHVNVERIRVLPSKGEPRYTVAHTPVEGHPDFNKEDAGEVTVAGAVAAWPGNLTCMVLVDWPGEEDFGGYIEYSSFGKADYREAKGKDVILYGHGAFAIENVRTLLEHGATKVIVMCRKRNLCGMKGVSWLVNYLDKPLPGPLMLESFQKIYDLVGFDCWSCHSVKTDAKRSFAHISQRTVFGVTDIYFLAGYYDVMEVVVDEVKRVTYQMVHTKKGKKIPIEVIIKAIGTCPSFKTDKMLGMKELHGFWCNNDPFRPVVCNAMYVEARNFGTFSSGPGFVAFVQYINWFLKYPEDYALTKGLMPINTAGERPAYVPHALHVSNAFMAIGQIPALAAVLAAVDANKVIKMRKSHPCGKFLEEAANEWNTYIKIFKESGVFDDRPEPPYPYTVDYMEDMVQRVDKWWADYAAARTKS